MCSEERRGDNLYAQFPLDAESFAPTAINIHKKFQRNFLGLVRIVVCAMRTDQDVEITVKDEGKKLLHTTIK